MISITLMVVRIEWSFFCVVELTKVYQSSIESDNSIESYAAHDLQTDRQTDRHFCKNHFF